MTCVMCVCVSALHKKGHGRGRVTKKIARDAAPAPAAASDILEQKRRKMEDGAAASRVAKMSWTHDPANPLSSSPTTAVPLFATAAITAYVAPLGHTLLHT